MDISCSYKYKFNGYPKQTNLQHSQSLMILTASDISLRRTNQRELPPCVYDITDKVFQLSELKFGSIKILVDNVFSFRNESTASRHNVDLLNVKYGRLQCPNVGGLRPTPIQNSSLEFSLAPINRP